MVILFLIIPETTVLLLEWLFYTPINSPQGLQFLYILGSGCKSEYMQYSASPGEADCGRTNDKGL